MKTNYLLLLLFMIPFSGNGQTFSYRYDLGFSSTVFNSVLISVDNEIIISGTMLDLTLSNSVGSFLGKFSESGDIVFIQPLAGPGISYQTWRNDLFELGPDTLLVSGYGFDSSGAFGIIIAYSDLGDTLFTKKLYSPFYPEQQFIASSGGLKKFGNDLLFVTNVSNEETNPASSDTYLICLDESFEIKWTNLFESTVDDFSKSVQIRDSNIIIGSNNNNQNITNNNFTSRLHLLSLDENGDLIGQFFYPPFYEFLMGPADAMVVEDDGSLVVASREGHEEVHSPSWSEIYWQNCILKVNPELDEVEWLRPMRSGEMPSPLNQFTSILKVEDNSGYIATGHGFYNGELGLGAIAKVSLTGDSLWLRHFQFVYSEIPHHVFNDLDQTSDGGFVLVGEATNYSPDTLFPPPIQQGWIVKVDEHGCLVPGCHLISDVKEVEAEIQINLQAYPNPATDFLHLFFKRPGNDFATWQFRVYDLMGREQTRFQTDFSEMSFILEVQDWAAGIYFLEAIGPGGEREVLEVSVQ